VTDESIRSAASDTPAAARGEGSVFDLAGFDEARYLAANPDVALAVRAGAAPSGRAHYQAHGAAEGRDLALGAGDPRDRLIASPVPADARPSTGLNHSVEAVFVCANGGVAMIGWVDDRDRPLDSVLVIGPGWRVTFDGASLARIRRPDVAQSLGRPDSHAFGCLGFVYAGQEIRTGGVCQVEFRARDGGLAGVVIELKAVEEVDMRAILLGHLAGGQHGAPISIIAGLAQGMGDQIVRLNTAITQGIVKAPYVERFGDAGRKHLGSIVICLYGRSEYHFIQNALFSGKPGIEHYELIFVCNSPELSEFLLHSARNAHRVYGLDQTLVLLPGNAGFGAANNVAVQSARTGRVLIVNPDVFPKDPAWAEKHLELVEALPHAQTDLFGSTLHYDDGSLMHGGMFFELDRGLSFQRGRTAQWQLLRVEHYGKGAPPDAPEHTRARPVPAVTGAFISAARPWFEKLGGFTEDFVFGHYEDADLCLKSLKAGTAPWLHDLRLWHLEGKGSTRLPVHEGGSLVNRWLFSSRWGDFVSADLLGPAPTHPLLAPPEAPADRKAVPRGSAKAAKAANGTGDAAP
jgi:GT2 family glycosyltransferase